MSDRLNWPARIRRGRRVALAGAVVALLAFAGGARGATHDYCAWDGSYLFLNAYTTCFQSGENYLANNHAWLPYVPSVPTIYCGAHAGGQMYGGWAGGWPSCDHGYGGGNSLKAAEFVDSSATTHGQIAY